MTARPNWIRYIPALLFGVGGLLSLTGVADDRSRPEALIHAAVLLMAAAIGTWLLRRNREPITGRWRTVGWVALVTLFVLAAQTGSRPLQDLLQSVSGLIWWLMYPTFVGWVTLGAVILLSLLAAILHLVGQ